MLMVYQFTFHYVSISTGDKDTYTEYKYNLHSTMYLFQHFRRRNNVYLNVIYIPLCIYFNCDYVLDCVDVVDIYIPLCIYFNWLRVEKYRERKAFTFHYVSISTLPPTPSSLPTSSFTFHYVSISTEILCNLFIYLY